MKLYLHAIDNEIEDLTKAFYKAIEKGSLQSAYDMCDLNEDFEMFSSRYNINFTYQINNFTKINDNTVNFDLIEISNNGNQDKLNFKDYNTSLFFNIKDNNLVITDIYAIP